MQGLEIKSKFNDANHRKPINVHVVCSDEWVLTHLQQQTSRNLCFEWANWTKIKSNKTNDKAPFQLQFFLSS